MTIKNLNKIKSNDLVTTKERKIEAATTLLLTTIKSSNLANLIGPVTIATMHIEDEPDLELYLTNDGLKKGWKCEIEDRRIPYILGAPHLGTFLIPSIAYHWESRVDETKDGYNRVIKDFKLTYKDIQKLSQRLSML